MLNTSDDRIVLDLPMFGGRVMLVRTYSEWNAAVTELKGDDASHNLIEEDSHLGCEVRIAKSDTCPITTFLVGVYDGTRRTLLHELSHATFDICGYYGIPTDAGDANEFYAYCIEHLFHNLFRYFKVF